MVDRADVLSRHVVGACSAVPADSDAAAAAALCKEVGKAGVDFVWGQLRALQAFYEARLAAARDAGDPEPSAAYRAEFGSGGQELPASSSGQPEQQQDGGSPPPQQQEQLAAGSAGEPPANGQMPGSEDGAANGHQGSEQAPAAGLQQQQADALQSLDRSLETVWQAALPGTMLVVVTGQGDTSYSRCGPDGGGGLPCDDGPLRSGLPPRSAVA